MSERTCPLVRRQNGPCAETIHDDGVPARKFKIEIGMWMSAVPCVDRMNLRGIGSPEPLPPGASVVHTFVKGGETVVVYKAADHSAKIAKATGAPPVKPNQDVVRHPSRSILAPGRFEGEDTEPTVAVLTTSDPLFAGNCPRSVFLRCDDGVPEIPASVRWVAFVEHGEEIKDGELLGAIGRLDRARNAGLLRTDFGFVALASAVSGCGVDEMPRAVAKQGLAVLTKAGKVSRKKGELVKIGRPPEVAVVVTVHNSWRATKLCLESIETRDPGGGLKPVVIVVDDESAPFVSRQLSLFCSRMGWTLVRNQKRTGYTKAVNRGFAAACNAGAAWICALNSDTVVTSGWLWKLVRAGESDSANALVGPHSNNAIHLSTPMWAMQGDDPEALSEKLSLVSRKAYSEVITPTGFCLLFRRDVWDQIGPFNEEDYGEAYGEETDYWARMVKADAGRAVIADDCFVWHQGHASYTRELNSFRETQAIAVYRDKHHDVHAEKAQACAQNMQAIKMAHKRLPRTTVGSRPRVCFYLNEWGLYGGVLAIGNIVNHLIMQGWDARVAAPAVSADGMAALPMLTHPIPFESHAEMQNRLQSRTFGRGVVVATVWNTAAKVAEICSRHDGLKPAYFIQDDESRFTAPGGAKYTAEENVWSSYRAIPDLVINSRWVVDVVKAHGGERCKYIPVGVDTSLFHPRQGDDDPTVLMFYRPDTPRRGADMVREVCRKLRARDEQVRIVTFGGRSGLFDNTVEQLGVITQAKAAEAYAESTVFLEASTCQGFGLQGLEAMASGCALVSTRNLGIDNYGRDGENCLQIDVDDADAAVESILELLGNRERRRDMVASGLQTAAEFDWSEIARQHGEYYQWILDQ